MFVPPDTSVFFSIRALLVTRHVTRVTEHMIELAIPILVYLLVYTADYLRFVRNKLSYNYVSWETVALFLGGQVVIFAWYFLYFKDLLANAVVEGVLIGALLATLMIVAKQFYVEQYPMCTVGSRTERCLSLGYIIVKGTDIMFQQMVYFVLAVTLSSSLGDSALFYGLFLVILCIIHTPIILSNSQLTAQLLTLGIAVMAIPIAYIYTELTLLWPAVYLHVLLYFFYWITFSEHGTQNSV